MIQYLINESIYHLSTITKTSVLKLSENGHVAAFEAADKVEFQPSHPGYPKLHPSPAPRQVSNYPSWICGNEVYLTLVRFMSNVQLPLFLSVSASGPPSEARRRRRRRRGPECPGSRRPKVPGERVGKRLLCGGRASWRSVGGPEVGEDAKNLWSSEVRILAAPTWN